MSGNSYCLLFWNCLLMSSCISFQGSTTITVVHEVVVDPPPPLLQDSSVTMMTLILNVLGVLCTSSSSPVSKQKHAEGYLYTWISLYINYINNKSWCDLSVKITTFLHDGLHSVVHTLRKSKLNLSLSVLSLVLCLTFCTHYSCQQQNLMFSWFTTLPFYAYLCVCDQYVHLSFVSVSAGCARPYVISLWNQYLYIHTAPYICIYIYKWQHFCCCCCASRLRQIESIDKFKWDINLI